MSCVIIDAVYENGVLRPLEPVTMDENVRFRVFVYRAGANADIEDLIDHEAMEDTRREVAKMERVPTLEEMQDRFRDIPGSFADAIIAEREDK